MLHWNSLENSWNIQNIQMFIVMNINCFWVFYAICETHTAS